MQKFFLFACSNLFIWGGLSAQCLSQPACPVASTIFCDMTTNNPYYWNNLPFHDPIVQSHDLGEAPTDLSIQITDSCGTGNVQASFVLLLDLNGDGVRETAVSSEALPGTGVVYYGNAANPNYTGGQVRQFDTRLVPTNEIYEFALERIEQAGQITVRVRWTNALDTSVYVLPELPGGTHRVEWRFEQDGAVKLCSYNFTVKDCQPPTMLCGGLNINIMPTNPLAVQMWAIDFVQHAEDNYTLTDQLKYAIRRAGTGIGFPVNSPGVLFSCDDIGTQYVEVWVKDLAGNATFCETYVLVQDNFGACGPGNPPINVCAVSYCSGAGIEEIDVELQRSNLATPPFSLLISSTGNSGCVAIDNSVPIASNFTITPVKDNNPLNGVTTYDLILISKHILAIEPLGSPYKIIAADANRSNSVTTADIVELRKLIIGIYQELPSNNSWRFVDSSFVFPNPNNPFQTIFPEKITIANLQSNLTAGFYGIKIGDVNCNAIINVNQTSEEEALTIPDLHLQTDDIVEVPVRFSQANAYYGFQFGLQFDPAKVELLEVIPVVGTKDNFGLFQDRVNVSWSAIYPALFLSDESAFRLRIKALAPLHLADVFRLTTEKLHAEAYSESDNPINLRLQFVTTAPEATQTIFNPQPNPTSAGIHLPLRLEQSETVTIEILDGTGRLLYQQTQTKDAGAQWLEVPATTFPQAGVYMWRVVAGVESKAGKIIKQ